MRFSWKMILLVALILAISLSIGSYTMVWMSFQTQIESEIDGAQEDMQMFSLMLQAIGAGWEESETNIDAEKILKLQMKEGGALAGHEFSAWDESGNQIVCTERMFTSFQMPESDGSYIESRFVQLDGPYIVTTCAIPFCGQNIYLQRERDVYAPFIRAEQDLKNNQVIMICLLAAGTLLTAVFTLVLTRPLRLISQTAHQLSAGRYDKRVPVHRDDELGRVAKDFNAMADVLEGQIYKLGDALKRQREFTASFAHELKTPLTSVIGYADTLRSRVLPPEQQFEAADYIVSEGKRLEAMSFALLDLFSLEREEPVFSEVSILRLLEAVKKSCDYILQEKGIKLVIRAEKGEVSASFTLLHTLLYNLIDNAKKASEEGSIIEIEGIQTEKGYVLRVRDHGAGIPREVLNRITEPFYMVDKSRARAQGGAGLGLALCNRIAKIHGSTLKFYSEVGKGTEVSFTLGGEVQ